MALPSTREELKQFCLRKLGAPVIDINLDNQQIEDRIDEAILYFQEFHFDGVEKVYLKHKVTATIISFSGVASGTFTTSETVTGGTSGATAVVIDQASDDLSIRVNVKSGTFVDSEIITGSSSSVTATLAGSSSVVLGDIDNKSIDIDAGILSITKIVPAANAYSGEFGIQYQFALNSLPNIFGYDIISYSMLQSHLNLIDRVFNNPIGYRFNRKMNKIFLDINWDSDISVDTYIVFEAYAVLDPNTYTEVYSDRWLIPYTTALLKKQWGNNLSKFTGITLPGGVELNGQAIKDEAITEIEKLEENIKSEFSEPPMFFIE